MTGKKFHVFVYGTLKGMHRGRLLGPAETLSDFVMFDGGFPVVLPTDDPDIAGHEKAHARILGELHEVDEFSLQGLDNYEGYPDFYNRIETLVRTKDGIETEAWMYIGSGVKESLPRRSVVLPDDTGHVSWGRR